MKKELNVIIAFVAVWCAGIVLSPLISMIHPAGESLSNFLYKFYGVVCHQFDSRSFHVYDHPFTVCIRCTSIYFGFLIALIGVRCSSKLYEKEYNPVLVLISSLVPMLLDVACSFTPFYEISIPSRMISGTIFGIGLALLLHRSLTETISSLILSKHHEIKTR